MFIVTRSLRFEDSQSNVDSMWKTKSVKEAKDNHRTD